MPRTQKKEGFIRTPSFSLWPKLFPFSHVTSLILERAGPIILISCCTGIKSFQTNSSNLSCKKERNLEMTGHNVTNSRQGLSSNEISTYSETSSWMHVSRSAKFWSQQESALFGGLRPFYLQLEASFLQLRIICLQKLLLTMGVFFLTSKLTRYRFTPPPPNLQGKDSSPQFGVECPKPIVLQCFSGPSPKLTSETP